MRKYCLLLIIIALLGCKKQNVSYKDIVTEHYTSRNLGDFEVLKTTISDSITIISGDYIMPYNHATFYEQQYQWDSIFKSSYRIIELKKDRNRVIATVSQNNLRNAFLENNPLIFTNEISFKDGRISKIKELEYRNVNWTSWSKQKNDLVNWIRNNHPRLDGFVEDMSLQGARNYLRAIELYENRN